MQTKSQDLKTRLAQIAAEDPTLGSFIRIDDADATRAARTADERRVNGTRLSPLDGIVVAVKDNLAVAEKPWTAGIAGRRAVIADQDAAAVARLRAAGAIIVGGTNMDEAALGASADNTAFGRCANPLDPDLTPGGSSGGSAAALAAGFVDLALGTDTMGSVRVPAAYCGVAGIKPTFGAIDRAGLMMLSPSLDTIGPMARDVRLLWPVLQVLAGPEAMARWQVQSSRADLSGACFGLPTQIATVDCDVHVLAGLERAREVITALGGIVQDIDLSGWDPHRARRAGLLVIEAEGALELSDLIEQPGAISDHLRSMLVYGRDAPAEKVATARAEIARAAEAAVRAFNEVDALLLPTAPQRAFAHGTPAPANQADLTALANFAGCPAVALPVELPGERLPVSIQMIGPKWSDPNMLGWAECLAEPLSAPT